MKLSLLIKKNNNTLKRVVKEKTKEVNNFLINLKKEAIKNPFGSFEYEKLQEKNYMKLLEIYKNKGLKISNFFSLTN